MHAQHTNIHTTVVPFHVYHLIALINTTDVKFLIDIVISWHISGTVKGKIEGKNWIHMIVRKPVEVTIVWITKVLHIYVKLTF